jgi:hypothetical protein
MQGFHYSDHHPHGKGRTEKEDSRARVGPCTANKDSLEEGHTW